MISYFHKNMKKFQHLKISFCLQVNKTCLNCIVFTLTMTTNNFYVYIDVYIDTNIIYHSWYIISVSGI